MIHFFCSQKLQKVTQNQRGNKMTHLSRTTLINALAKVKPETPRVMFEALSDKALDAEFRAVTAEYNEQASQLMSVSY